MASQNPLVDQMATDLGTVTDQGMVVSESVLFVEALSTLCLTAPMKKRKLLGLHLIGNVQTSNEHHLLR